MSQTYGQNLSCIPGLRLHIIDEQNVTVNSHLADVNNHIARTNGHVLGDFEHCQSTHKTYIIDYNVFFICVFK